MCPCSFVSCLCISVCIYLCVQTVHIMNMCLLYICVQCMHVYSMHVQVCLHEVSVY